MCTYDCSEHQVSTRSGATGPSDRYDRFNYMYTEFSCLEMNYFMHKQIVPLAKPSTVEMLTVIGKSSVTPNTS